MVTRFSFEVYWLNFLFFLILFLRSRLNFLAKLCGNLNLRLLLWLLRIWMWRWRLSLNCRLHLLLRMQIMRKSPRTTLIFHSLTILLFVWLRILRKRQFRKRYIIGLIILWENSHHPLQLHGRIRISLHLFQIKLIVNHIRHKIEHRKHTRIHRK